MGGGQFQGKHVLLVVGDAGSVAVAPLLENFKGVGLVPVQEPEGVAIQARFFADLPPGRVSQAFFPFLAAGDGLPIPGVAGPFQQQDL